MIECLTSRNKPVIGMAEPLALPGSYMYDGSGMDVITDRLLREVEEYANYDFDGVILQNMQDTPVRQQSNFSAVACMTHLSEAVRREFPQLLQGILINWDGCASLAVAQAAKADFIRVEHCYVGAEVTTSGIINAQCPEILQMKRLTGADIPITADIYEPHAMPVCPRPIESMVFSAISQARVDALFLSGHNAQETIEMGCRARKVSVAGRTVPLYAGGGTNDANIYDILEVYDGVCIGHWIKDGYLCNPINPEKAKRYMSEVQRARENHGKV